MSYTVSRHFRERIMPRGLESAPRERTDTPILDRSESRDPAARLGLSQGSGRGDTSFQARRNEQDRKPPRENVTARLMGDPKPGRSAADGFTFPDRPPAPRTGLLLGDWPEEEAAQLWKLKAENKSQTEIARILRRPLGAVASKIRRTREA